MDFRTLIAWIKPANQLVVLSAKRCAGVLLKDDGTSNPFLQLLHWFQTYAWFWWEIQILWSQVKIVFPSRNPACQSIYLPARLTAPWCSAAAAAEQNGMERTKEPTRKSFFMLTDSDTDLQACELKFRLGDFISCLWPAAAPAVCFKGHVSGVDAIETWNEFIKLEF